MAIRRLDTYRGRGLPGEVKALGAASFFQDVASEMVYPLLPKFLLLLGGGPALLGVMESAAEGVLAVVKGAAGRWSDRSRRRKPFVAWGYGLSAAARPLMAAAAVPAHVISLRAFDRLGKGLRTAPRDALIAERTEAGRRAFAFSFHRGLDHLGAALGPLAAAAILALAPGNLRLVLALATVPAVCGWGAVVLRVRERPPAGAAAAGESPAAGISGLPRRLRLPLAAFFLFALGNASDAFLLLRAGEEGYSTVGITLLWSGFHGAKWLASAPAGALADRLGPRRPLLAGWALYAAVYVGFAWAEGPYALAALFALYALYYGLTEGAERAWVVSLAGGSTATALGAFHLVSGLGLFASSLLFGLVWEAFSPRAAFLLGASLAAAAASLVALGGGSRGGGSAGGSTPGGGSRHRWRAGDPDGSPTPRDRLRRRTGSLLPRRRRRRRRSPAG